jgi:hypothetical protein
MQIGKFYLLRDLEGEEIVKFGLEVIEFSEKYGVEAAREGLAFSGSTIYRWRKIYKERIGYVLQRDRNKSSLGFQNKEDYKDKGEILDPNITVSLYGKTGKLVIRKRKRSNAEKRQFLSQMSRRFKSKLTLSRRSELEDFLEKRDIIHSYTHPKKLQENGYGKQFQRTLQESLVDVYSSDSTDIHEFNRQTMLLLIRHNASKPHTGYNRDSPLKFMAKLHLDSSKEPMMLCNYQLASKTKRGLLK